MHEHYNCTYMLLVAIIWRIDRFQWRFRWCRCCTQWGCDTKKGTISTATAGAAALPALGKRKRKMLMMLHEVDCPPFRSYQDPQFSICSDDKLLSIRAGRFLQNRDGKGRFAYNVYKLKHFLFHIWKHRRAFQLEIDVDVAFVRHKTYFTLLLVLYNVWRGILKMVMTWATLSLRKKGCGASACSRSVSH